MDTEPVPSASAASRPPPQDLPKVARKLAGLIGRASWRQVLAELSAAFWGWRDRLGLEVMASRLRSFAPATLAPELERPEVSPVVTAAVRGWEELARRSPELHALAVRVRARPAPVTGALAATPATFLHGDWKTGNLGAHPDGRVILLDWAYPGAARRAGSSPGTWR